MKPLLLSTVLLALIYSHSVSAQTASNGSHITNNGPSMSTGEMLNSWETQANTVAQQTQQATPELQRITTSAPSNAQLAPSWEEGFGWERGQMEPAAPEVFQVSSDSWGSQALAALEQRRSASEHMSPDDHTRWEASILAAEQRLVQRLSEAKAAGEPYLIWVNLPAYRLRVLDTRDGSVVLESRAIVGKPGRATPRMDTRIINLKFNPDWTPPKSSPGSRYTPSGPRSPLGRVRFSADNGIGIYLHDTNQPDLYNTTRRAYSLGCVRVEQWRALAGLLAGEDDAWVDSKGVDWKTRWVDTPDVTAFLDYQRIDFDDNGSLLELPDIYSLGQRVR